MLSLIHIVWCLLSLDPYLEIIEEGLEPGFSAKFPRDPKMLSSLYLAIGDPTTQ